MPISQDAREEWKISRKDHPGSSADEIENEPDWAQHTGNDHYPGYKNSRHRRAGVTHEGDDWEEFDLDKERFERVKKKADEKNGQLVNWRDAVKSEKDIHLYHPEGHPFGWRYVLEYTEDEIKYQQEWPANVERREREEQKKEEEEEEEKKKEQGEGKRKKRDSQQSNEQSGSSEDGEGQNGESEQEKKPDDRIEYEKLRDKYTPQEIALLRALEHEKDYMLHLKSNDGKGRSGQIHNRADITISEDDQFTPDNWIPRSKELIRLTGKHPLNAEADLRRLFEAGFITPNELHYVRNHGPVPRLLWELHKLEITPFEAKEAVEFSMKDLQTKFDVINIPVLIGCYGGRRKELNMLKRTHGFNWGAAALGCAYWKGPLLRDVLMAAGVPEHMPGEDEKRFWVHLQAADNPGATKYETSIPFEYVMDATNDVILAYEMNDLPLPPDHGYPLRIVIPGYIGGRQVKWLQKIWISDKENESYWHIWDNRVVPSFITSQDGELANALFHNPSTALYEQYLNSVVTRPAQGETIPLEDIKKGSTYRIEGFAFNGRGDEVKRVEVTLDGGKTWLYCIRKFPKAPIRHGKKFWTWLNWHVDVPTGNLIAAAEGIRVRAWDVSMSTQPETRTWNLMGAMNNVQYIVKPEIVTNANDKGSTPHVLFRHPVEPGNGEGGWYKDSAANQIADAKRETGAPKKQFTRAEIEKHDKEDDCWIVVDGKVYDATSVMSWHPGGKAPIMMHAGAVHWVTTEEFSAVHDDSAREKLNECVLGVVTDKAAALIQKTKEDSTDPDASAPKDQALLKHRWTPATLTKRDWISQDTAAYTFTLPKTTPFLGLGTCQHIEFGFHLKDKMLIRQYTPTRPILPRDSGIKVAPNSELKDAKDLYDGSQTVQVTIKTYFPNDNQPGGALSNILAAIPLGEEIEMRGPTGEILYHGDGRFTINGQEKSFKRISLVLGGTGLTPGYSLLARVALDPNDNTPIRVIDANKSEGDILLHDELDKFVKLSNGALEITHVLSHPSDKWKGLKGHVNEDIVKEKLFPPKGKENLVLLCGPPGMIQKAAVPALEHWGYVQGENVFGL